MIIKTDSDTIETYLSDASNLKGISNQVLIPESKDELKQTIIQLYNNNDSCLLYTSPSPRDS